MEAGPSTSTLFDRNILPMRQILTLKIAQSKRRVRLQSSDIRETPYKRGCLVVLKKQGMRLHFARRIGLRFWHSFKKSWVF
jgi:hypothetical protein